MNRLAKIMSGVFSPILVPTYGVFLAIWASILSYNPAATRWLVVGMTFLLTGLLPMAGIYILYRTGRISDPGLNTRTERAVPYIITGVCYAACGLYLYNIHAPLWLVMLPAGGCLAVIISLVVNHWWKISAHLAAMGGVVAELFRIAVDRVALPGIEWWIAGAVILTGLLATSRVVLGRHTLGQVLAGTANGFLCVYLLSAI